MEKAREAKEREEQRKKRVPLKPLQPRVAASPLNRTVAIDGILKTGLFITYVISEQTETAEVH